MAVANKHLDPFSKGNYILGSINMSSCWTHGFGNPSLRWRHSQVLYHHQQPFPASHAASSHLPDPYLHRATELALTTCSWARTPCSALFQHRKPKWRWSATVAHLHAGQGQLLRSEAPTHPPRFSPWGREGAGVCHTGWSSPHTDVCARRPQHEVNIDFLK